MSNLTSSARPAPLFNGARRASARRSFDGLAALLFVIGAAALGCDGDVECAGAACGASSSSSGGGGGGSGVDCSHDLPGAPFVFHVVNSGTRMLRLTYGCGKTMPITILAAGGDLGIAPGNADACEFSCDDVYAGAQNVGCSDCGPGYGASLNPNEMVDIQWDRRVFSPFMVDPKCSGNADGNACGLGALVKSASTTGTLTICNDGFQVEGYCSPSNQEKVPFSINLGDNELTISVQ